jgi:hypothetical protein
LENVPSDPAASVSRQPFNFFGNFCDDLQRLLKSKNHQKIGTLDRLDDYEPSAGSSAFRTDMKALDFEQKLNIEQQGGWKHDDSNYC